MTSPLATIIIPAYNAARHLRRAIPRLMAGGESLEVIVISDGSTDGTAALLERFLHSYPRLKVINQPENQGPAAARLAGLSHAEGKYVAFMDADDKLYTHAFKEILSGKVIKECRPDIIICGVKVHFAPLPLTHSYNTPYEKQLAAGGINTLSPAQTRTLFPSLLRGEITPNLHGKIFRRELLQSICLKSSPYKIGEDYDLCLQIFSHISSAVIAPQCIYQWRYSGLGAKYFLNEWKQYSQALEYTITHTLPRHLPLSTAKEEALAQMALPYFHNLREACIMRAMRRRDTTNFLQSTLATPLYRQMAESHPHWQTLDMQKLTPRQMQQEARHHLKSHKKYYLLIRLLTHLLS